MHRSKSEIMYIMETKDSLYAHEHTHIQQMPTLHINILHAPDRFTSIEIPLTKSCHLRVVAEVKRREEHSRHNPMTFSDISVTSL